MIGAPPIISDVSRPWWDALARNEIAVQQCNACEHWIFYPRAFCPACGGRELIWQKVVGNAMLYSWSVARVPVDKAFAHLKEPVLAIVELEIGIRVPTSLCDVPPEDIRIGMALTPVFDHDSYSDVTLLRYRPTNEIA
jgi:uncharacterized OB-fold protein